MFLPFKKKSTLFFKHGLGDDLPFSLTLIVLMVYDVSLHTHVDVDK